MSPTGPPHINSSSSIRLGSAACSGVRTAHPVCGCTQLFHHARGGQTSFTRSAATRRGSTVTRNAEHVRITTGLEAHDDG